MHNNDSSPPTSLTPRLSTTTQGKQRKQSRGEWAAYATLALTFTTASHLKALGLRSSLLPLLHHGNSASGTTRQLATKMTFLRNLTGHLWNYVSPRKTQQRRDKEFKVPAVPIRPTPLKRRVGTPESREMSPQSRIQNWSVRTPSPLSDVDGDTDMDRTLLPPSPPASAKQGDDFEGDTLIGSPGAEYSEKAGSSADEWNANEDTIVVDDGNYLEQSVDVNKERKRREKQGRQLRETGWSEDAVFLFQKLGMRGFEPLLPIDWVEDLETLPEDLFTSRLDNAFLKPTLGSGFRGEYLYLFQADRRLTDNSTTGSKQPLRPWWLCPRCEAHQGA
jgi:hypothetical protein